MILIFCHYIHSSAIYTNQGTFRSSYLIKMVKSQNGDAVLTLLHSVFPENLSISWIFILQFLEQHNSLPPDSHKRMKTPPKRLLALFTHFPLLLRNRSTG